MRWCGLITGLFFSFGALAQGNVAGFVVEKASGLPIEYATIVLIKLPVNMVVKATATDKKGRYIFTGIDSGTYKIQCSFIGFDKMESEVFLMPLNTSRVDIPLIELAGDGKKMDDITVTSRKLMLNTSIDR